MSGNLRSVFAAARQQQAEPEQSTQEPEKAIAKPARLAQKKVKAQPSKIVGKSSQEDYERLTVYVRKQTKDDLARSLIGTERDMSDVVQALLDKHLVSQSPK